MLTVLTSPTAHLHEHANPNRPLRPQSARAVFRQAVFRASRNSSCRYARVRNARIASRNPPSQVPAPPRPLDPEAPVSTKTSPSPSSLLRNAPRRVVLRRRKPLAATTPDKPHAAAASAASRRRLRKRKAKKTKDDANPELCPEPAKDAKPLLRAETMYGHKKCWLVAVVEKPAPKPVQQYDVRSMMVMAASMHSMTSLFDTREELVDADLDFLLNDRQGMHEDRIDEWCDYALVQEEERMNALLPQKFRSPSPPPRYPSSCVEVKRGLRARNDLFLKKGTPPRAVTYPARRPREGVPARAVFVPIRNTAPSWAARASWAAHERERRR